MEPRLYRYETSDLDQAPLPGPGPRLYTPRPDRYWLHLLLFLLTLVASIYAGRVLVGRELWYEEAGPWAEVVDGLLYAVPLLIFLTVHEFGHYFAARYHRISTTLPYYIPSPLPLLSEAVFNIGTFGAVIRIREAVPSTRKLFDIGAAGPIAGFVVALGMIVYALATLPPLTYLNDLAGHPEIKELLAAGRPLPATSPAPFALTVGQTPLFWLLVQFFPNVPPMYEIYHYPVLFAGWLGLFFTALNLMPIGQLDGGHITYALVGAKWHGRLARGFILLLLLSASVGFSAWFGPLLTFQFGSWGLLITWLALIGLLLFFLRRTFPQNPSQVLPALFSLLGLVLLAEWIGPSVTQYGYWGWFPWCVLLVVFIKIDHPPVLYTEPLTPRRRALGILAMLIFVLCFSLRPLFISEASFEPPQPSKPIAGQHIEARPVSTPGP